MVKKLQITQIVMVMLFVMFTQQAIGQKIVFDKIDAPTGSTYGFVTCITQDINGEMWFSSKLGLFKYDGNLITQYVHDPINDNTPQSNFLEVVYADSKGFIWMGSLGDGLSRFEPASGTFTHYKHKPNESASLSHDTVTAILQDKFGDIWIATHGGLDKFNAEENNFTHYKSDSDDSSSLSSNLVRKIYEDNDGTLWIGAGSPYPGDGGSPDGGGLNRYNREEDNFTRFLHDPDNENSLLNNKICAIYQDDTGVLWIGTGNYGLHKLDKETGKIERVIYDKAFPDKFGGPETEGTEINQHITFINQDIKGNYWLGTVENGIFHFDREMNKMNNFSSSSNSDSQFNEVGAWSCYSSTDGIVWFGTTTSGNIYRFNPIKNEFPHYLTPASVNDFYEDENDNLWIATDENLIIKDLKNESQKEYIFTSKSGDNSNHHVQTIYEDIKGKIWVGSSGGLFSWDKNKEKFVEFNLDAYKMANKGGKDIISIYEDFEDNFWIATANGFKRLNKKTNSFENFYVDTSDTVNVGKNIITSLLRDKNDFWIGTWNGNAIYLYDLQNNTSKQYVRGSSVARFLKDHRNELWAVTFAGLIKYESQTDKFIRYTDPGLTSGFNNVLGIVEDNDNYLWISSLNGILRINPDRNESVKIGKNYGIENDDLVWNSVYKGNQGNLYFGTETGYFIINPTEFLDKKNAPIVNLSNFRISDNLVVPGDGGPLKEELSETNEIRLQFDQNVFSIDFNIIDYANPDENQLVYFLENYDKNWMQANSARKAYYFNIPPGNYTFRVKGANSYGKWAEKKLNIVIMPPWYRSSWAYGFYAILFVALVFGFDKIQRRRLLLLEKKKAQKRELQHAREIEKAYTELKATQTQLVQSEKMASLGELTAGIAHEIQNPLNFVNNFSEVNKELLEELNEELETGNLDEVKLLAKDVIDNEEKINYHGKRADAIVKGMLQHSRSSSGVKEPTDINALADEYLRLAYHGLRAKDKSFNATMNTNFDEQLTNVNVIPQDIGRVILNLITNAFYAVADKKKKHTKGYEPTVSVNTKKEKNNVIISVQDNGNGIPQAALEKIFQPFFTTKPTGEGTGLGLSMSYEIITKAHNGELKVDNQPGEGATFTIILPV